MRHDGARILKRRNMLLSGIVVSLLIAITIGATSMQRFLNSPLTVTAPGAELEIGSGSSFRLVSDELEQRGILSNSFLFRLYARWTDQASAIQAGDYLINSGATPTTLLEQLVSGDVQLYSFTIVEGWNHRELLQALHIHEQIDATMTDEDWPALLEELGAITRHPEGLFLPETYHVPRNSSDRALLKQAYLLMNKTLQEEWDKRAEEIQVKTPYEALILASIVEKETARADEREKIAGVFSRRMLQRMRLETDPTVIYGIGPAFNGNLTRKDLRTDTPYNTYTRRGLPPTPIAMTGRAAIHAALHPADGKELFFVATGLGDGSHKFSETIDEHNDAVAEYLRRLRQQRQQGN